MSLFNHGLYTLHSGGQSSLKIDCDALTGGDLQAVAEQLMQRLPPFGAVEGVPRGGLRLAEAFGERSTFNCKTFPPLIVDDVLTTGASMEAQRSERDAIGAVIFARGPCPDWVTPLFVMSECVP